MLGTGTARVQERIFDFINQKKKKRIGKFEKIEKFEKKKFDNFLDTFFLNHFFKNSSNFIL